MNIRWTWRLLGSLFLLFLLSACGGTTTQSAPAHATMSGMSTPTTVATMTTDPMTESLKNLAGKPFEVSFLQEMIVHHQSAVDMAALVPTHTKRAELITLAQQITTAQKHEIQAMTGWLKQWYGEKPLGDAMQVPGMMEMMNSMDTLKSTKDARFDQQFLTMMISHHQEAVTMARLLPQKTQRPELLTLGQNIITTQSAEIGQMQRWQKAWFHA